VPDEFEKFGVVEDGDGTKTAAAEKGLCPDCGSKLLPKDESNVLRCPKCGTKPFEKAQ
jgi:DNA-directed RNA polymerase subunit RPC12/RpoP